MLKIEKMPFLKSINLQYFKQLKRLEKTDTPLEMMREELNFIQKLSNSHHKVKKLRDFCEQRPLFFFHISWFFRLYFLQVGTH